MLHAESTEALCFWDTDVIDGVFGSVKLCSVFRIKEDGLGFACFSIFMCCLCVGNSTVLLLQ